MKKVAMILVMVLMVSACGNNMVINGKEFETIGLVNIIVNDESILPIKDPQVKYRVIWGNVILGAILFETIFAPIYFFGFSMLEPVGDMK